MNQKKVAVVAGAAIAVVLVLVVGWRLLPSGDSDVPEDSVNAAVHDSISGYANKLSVDFSLASKAVADGTIKTDAQLYEFVYKNTVESRVEAFHPFDQMLQDNLPRDVDKLKPEAKAFLEAISEAFAKEGSHSHE